MAVSPSRTNTKRASSPRSVKAADTVILVADGSKLDSQIIREFATVEDVAWS